MIVAVINHKGGVGKTTTAVNLAAAWADGGASTLLVDLDGQCSASLHLGVRKSESDVSEAFRGAQPVALDTAIRGLQLWAGSADLSGADAESTHPLRLSEALNSVKSRYDRVVIDCPPALSLPTLNALKAANALLIPVSPHYLAMEGLASLLRFIRAQASGGPRLGIVLTMVDSRARMTGEVIQLLRERFGSDVLSTEIKNNIRLSEASSFGQSIFQYDARCPGARLYAQLKDEVEQRWHAKVV